MAMTGIADNPELIAWVDCWYFSLSRTTDCSRSLISDLHGKEQSGSEEFYVNNSKQESRKLLQLLNPLSCIRSDVVIVAFRVREDVTERSSR